MSNQAFDVLALRHWEDEPEPVAEELRTLMWEHLKGDISAAADYIERLEAERLAWVHTLEAR